MTRRSALVPLCGAVLLLLFSSVTCIESSLAQRPQPPDLPLSEALVNRLPAEMRERAKALVTATQQQQEQWAKASDEDLRGAVAARLAAKPEAAELVLSLLAKDPSAKVRRAIIGAMRTPYWRSNAQAQKALEGLVANDPDAGVSLQALELLRSNRTGDLARMLDARLEAARRANDAAALKLLADEHERWISLERGTMLPAFMRTVPPAFSLKPAEQAIRVLAFGDFGTGSEGQHEVARSTVAEHRKTPFDFGVTLGDNFYSIGMLSPNDPRWQTQWEALYGPLGIKFYATFGNHDWGHPDSPAAEILYAAKSDTWRLPAPYYTFTAGPVQFFALDTNKLSVAQLLWLDAELQKSSAPWKVVYGHHHIYSATRGDNKELIAQLLPLLQKGGAQVYLCGHDHNLQHLKPEGGVHFFVAGGGGAGVYETNEYPRTLFKAEKHGYSTLEADAKKLKIRLVGADGKQLYDYAIEKAEQNKAAR